MAETLIEVPMMSQERTRWCWAAVASGVGASLNGTGLIPQCEIAAATLNVPQCCTDPNAGNVTAALDLALSEVSCVAVPVNPKSFGFPNVVTEIVARKRPIGARIVDHGNGSAHFVLIIGCDPNGETIVASDPWGNVGAAAPRYRMPFEKFKGDYGGWGECSHLFRIS